MPYDVYCAAWAWDGKSGKLVCVKEKNSGKLIIDPINL